MFEKYNLGQEVSRLKMNIAKTERQVLLECRHEGVDALEL